MWHLMTSVSPALGQSIKETPVPGRMTRSDSANPQRRRGAHSRRPHPVAASCPGPQGHADVWAAWYGGQRGIGNMEPGLRAPEASHSESRASRGASPGGVQCAAWVHVKTPSSYGYHLPDGQEVLLCWPLKGPSHQQHWKLSRARGAPLVPTTPEPRPGEAPFLVTNLELNHHNF